MKWRENTARIVLLVIVLGVPLALYGFQRIWPQLGPIRVIDISASIAENGGFQPDSITVQEGETVTLRFHSNDVTHGVALGPALGIDLGDIDPGHVKEVTLTFDKAGTYTFYCNTWCSPKHWRMRGSVYVYPTSGILPTPPHDPVIDALVAEDVNIDAMPTDTATLSDMSKLHTAEPLLSQLPSVSRGAELVLQIVIPTELKDVAWRSSHTPAETLQALTTANPSTAQLDLADAVAYLWTMADKNNEKNPEMTFNAATYYAKDCAACHGEAGNGKGPMASTTAKQPVNFTDINHMLMMRDDVLYAKIRRGGMGTDMPNFGTLLTPDETWQLVNYLRKFSTTP